MKRRKMVSTSTVFECFSGEDFNMPLNFSFHTYLPDLPHSTNVAPIKIDDEAEYELNDILAKARRLKQTEQMTKNGSKFSRKIMAFKGEDEESSDEEEKTFIGKSAIVFDATSEKYKAIGGGGGYGGGTRKESKKEEPHEMEEEEEEEEMDAEKFMEIMNEETKKKKKQRRRRTESVC